MVAHGSCFKLSFGVHFAALLWRRGTVPFSSKEILEANAKRAARSPGAEEALCRAEGLISEAKGRAHTRKAPASEAEQRARPAPTWTQAMRNTMWASTLLATLPTAEKRREAFASLAAEAVRRSFLVATGSFRRSAHFYPSHPPLNLSSRVPASLSAQPFFLPRMTATPAAVLMEPGASIHRLDLTDTSAGAWRPTPVEKIPPGSHVLFISHRWLRPGQPDDEHGTKLRRVEPRCCVLRPRYAAL